MDTRGASSILATQTISYWSVFPVAGCNPVGIVKRGGGQVVRFYHTSPKFGGSSGLRRFLARILSRRVQLPRLPPSLGCVQQIIYIELLIQTVKKQPVILYLLRQVGKASDFDSDIRWFESIRGCQLYSVRLSVRTTAFQVVKTGSIPVLSTIFSCKKENTVAILPSVAISEIGLTVSAYKS